MAVIEATRKTESVAQNYIYCGTRACDCHIDDCLQI